MYAAIEDILKRYDIDVLINMAGLSRGYGGKADLALLDEKLAHAIKDASNEMDLYLDRRYFLPLPNIPEILTEACVDLAIFRMPANMANQSNSITDKAKFWRKELEAIAAGKRDLPGLPDKTADGENVVNHDGAVFEADEGVFTLAQMKGFGL